MYAFDERLLERIARALEHIERDFHRQYIAVDFQLFQIKGENFMSITGVQAGGSGVFQASLVPANAVPLQSGPKFSTDDTKVTLTQDTTDPFKVTGRGRSR